jgi:hypothetical protein
VVEHAVIENLPCADAAFLDPLRSSHEFASIRDRLVCEEPVDSWVEGGFHFFVFEIVALPSDLDGGEKDEPVAVFVMHGESSSVVSAVMVEPRPGNAEAEIRDLRVPETGYTAPYPR